jgi:hypothetical protein
MYPVHLVGFDISLPNDRLLLFRKKQMVCRDVTWLMAPYERVVMINHTDHPIATLGYLGFDFCKIESNSQST